jgi:hypothetical protein
MANKNPVERAQRRHPRACETGPLICPFSEMRDSHALTRINLEASVSSPFEFATVRVHVLRKLNPWQQ